MPEFISYDRATNKISTVSQPLGGVWGQASFHRLCDIIEKSGELRPGEKIKGFVIENGWFRFQVEQ